MKKIGLDSFQLKMIGVVLMVLDHLHQFFTTPLWFTWLGRIVAPIFLFTSSEGFVHTRNKNKYLFRLLVGFWLMGIGNLTLSSIFDPSTEGPLLINNIFETLFLCVFYMRMIDLIKTFFKETNYKKLFCAILCLFVPIILSLPALYLENINLLTITLIAVPNLLLTEGGILLVVLGVAFYIFHGKKALQIASLLIISFFPIILAQDQNLFTDYFQWMSCFAAIPIILYNNEKGKSMKNFFYWFYPAHIYLFYIISILIK